MSLQNLAYQVQSRGRDDDTMLVHMTPGEVKGLQALAVAHGGSLTVNPETGLAEAGFLKKILPAVAGAALTAFTPIGALGAAGIVGGATALSSGDLGQGLMAGLGAYGGAQLGTAAGLGGAAAGAGTAGAQAATAAGATGAQSAGTLAQTATVEGVKEGAKQQAMQQAVAGEAAKKVAEESMLSSMSPYLMASAPLMAGALMEQPETITPPAEEPSYIRPYTFDRNVDRDAFTQDGTGGERLYFRDEYTALPVRRAQTGGIMSLANGGPAQTRITPDEFINQYLTPVRTVTQIPGGMSGYEGEYAPKTGGAVIAPVAGAGGDYTGRGTETLTDESGKKYTIEFDPTTGEYRRVYLPEKVKPAASSAAADKLKDMMNRDGGGDMGPSTVGPGPSGINTGPSQAVTDAMAYGYNALGLSAPQQSPAPVTNMDTPYGFSPTGVTSSSDGFGPDGGGSASGNSGSGPAGSVGADGSPGSGTAGANGTGGWRQGGLLSYAQGGLAQDSFIVPADVVSAMGNGSTKAGLAALNSQLQGRKAGGATLIQGAGDGLSDSIPTHIDGKQPARVADGEAYINPQTVKRLGGGNQKKGAAKLYAMMNNVRKQAHGKTAQQRKVNPAKAMG